jgi:hypothetical protein
MPFFENTEILRRDVQVLDRILIFNNGNQNPFFGILVEDLLGLGDINTRIPNYPPTSVEELWHTHTPLSQTYG